MEAGFMDSTTLSRFVRRVSAAGVALAGAICLTTSVGNAQTVIQITSWDGTVLPAAASLYTTSRHCAPAGPVTVCDWYVRRLYGENAAVVVTINTAGGDPACYSGFTQYIVSGYSRSGCAVYATAAVYGIN
jgi:hypothetical protein